MKKIALLLTLAILIPLASFATPAETAGVPPSPVNFKSLKQYLQTRDYLHKKYDNGLRSWEFKPYVYKSPRLQYKNIGAKEKPQFPGIEYKKLCYHWKNCVRRVYQASDGYDKSYKKYTPKPVINKGLDLAFNDKKRKGNVSNSEVRSGNYKLWNWRFITPKNR